MNLYGNYTIEELESVGGKQWNDRVYFNDLGAIYGLTYNTYKSGNISSASLNGEPISNGRARKLADLFSFCKLWFNTTTQTFETKNLNNSDVIDTLVGVIQKRIADLRTEKAIIAATATAQANESTTTKTTGRKARTCKNNPAQMDMFSLFSL